MKKLSIAIPTYNRLVYLKECIRSILNQTFQDFSVYVFDNNSEEPVEEELKKFNDERIHFIGNDKNIGPIANINRILRYSFDSEYLVVFHDDDLMHPEMLEIQISFLEKNPDIVYVTSDFNEVSGKDMHQFRKIIKKEIKHNIYRNNYEFTKAIMLWLRSAFESAVYRVKFIGENFLEHNKFSDFSDLVFLVKISQKGPCAFTKAPLFNYRIHSGQDSRASEKDYEGGAINALNFLKSNFPAVLNKDDNELFSEYSLNFLIRAYAFKNNGFSGFLRFMKKCRRENLIKYNYFRYIDGRGAISLLSIIFRNQKIFDATKKFRNLIKIF